MKKHKCIERICVNCRLFDSGLKHCSVVVLHESQKVHIPVDPTDTCFFEQEYFDPTTQAIEDFNGRKQRGY